jgi:predicted house-cleaning noncanonical NTP pyrophosphatase (MazG superfamily)
LEVVATGSSAELIEELADVMEVVFAIAYANNIDPAEIEKRRIIKNNERGNFSEGLYISTIEIEE